MIVLGIDPGTARLGYGIVERTGSRLRMVDAGCLETPSELTLPVRLRRIHEGLVDLIALHAPDLVAVERLFFSRNAQTAFAVGQARGVVLLAAAEADLPVREATPNEVKTAVAGYGAADKEQVGRMVALCLGLKVVPTPDDAADALAVGIWAANSERTGGQRVAGVAGVLDRSSVIPIARGLSSYDRAVREAIQREGRAAPAGRTGRAAAKRAR